MTSLEELQSMMGGNDEEEDDVDDDVDDDDVDDDDGDYDEEGQGRTKRKFQGYIFL
jgi:hypothetical protein